MDNLVLQGDCLERLGDLPDGCADLVYADPPYGTGKDWGQFDDRWPGGLDGYLEYMRPRLEQCRRVLADTGSFWLHCDPTISHYLRVMGDDLFGRERWRNEIAWCYSSPGTASARQFQRKHDVLLWWSRSDRWVWNPPRSPYSPATVDKGRSQGGGFAEVGTDLHPGGKLMEDWWADIGTGWDMWSERCGYPTQKPEALLERIIRASSQEGGLVADPFAGSGTALVAAKRLGRRWWGCDLNGEAVALAESRLAAEPEPLPGLAGG